VSEAFGCCETAMEQERAKEAKKQFLIQLINMTATPPEIESTPKNVRTRSTMRRTLSHRDIELPNW
jgi:hypothetical protein